MKKRFIIIFCLLFSFSAFCKDNQNFDSATITFIENIYNKKIDCTQDNFYSNGFVKNYYGEFITTWEGLRVTAEVKDGNLVRFSFYSNDHNVFLAGWKKILFYAQSKNCVSDDFQIVVGNDIQTVKGYTFNHVALTNAYPYETQFFLSYAY